MKQLINKFKKTLRGMFTATWVDKRLTVALTLCAICCATALAQTGSYEAGTTALTTVATEITKYVPVVVKLCYAIAGVVAIVGAISVYVAMNNDEQDVKKNEMLLWKIYCNAPAK